jgi:hypothetical protein
LGDEILRAIGGTVIHQQHFKIGEGLLAQGLEANFQVLFPVEVRDDDGDGWDHNLTSNHVIPTKVGIHFRGLWIPACAGMTRFV